MSLDVTEVSEESRELLKMSYADFFQTYIPKTKQTKAFFSFFLRTEVTSSISTSELNDTLVSSYNGSSLKKFNMFSKSYPPSIMVMSPLLSIIDW